MDPRKVASHVHRGDLTLMDPLAGTRVTPCLLADQIGNTSMLTGSCSEGLLTLVPKGMQRVSARLSLSRNVLNVQRAKTKNAQVLSTGRRRSKRASISPLPNPAR